MSDLIRIHATDNSSQSLLIDKIMYWAPVFTILVYLLTLIIQIKTYILDTKDFIAFIFIFGYILFAFILFWKIYQESRERFCSHKFADTQVLKKQPNGRTVLEIKCSICGKCYDVLLNLEEEKKEEE